MTIRKTALDGATVATIDRITQMLLAQLEAQTQAALVLLDQAPPDQRDAFLAQLAEVRGRLVRLRAAVVGPVTPVLVEAAGGLGRRLEERAPSGAYAARRSLRASWTASRKARGFRPRSAAAHAPDPAARDGPVPSSATCPR